MYHGGTVYLVADNLQRGKEQFVLAHEALGHFGLAGLLGKGLNPLMDQIYRSNAEVRAAADARVAQAKARGLTYSTTLATEEALADLAGENRLQQLPQWRLLLAAIRKALRAIGFTVEFSDNDVLALLANARRQVEGPATARAVGATAAPAYSVADEAELAGLRDRERYLQYGEGAPTGEAKYRELREIAQRIAELDTGPQRYSIDDITERATQLFTDNFLRTPRKLPPVLKGFQTQFHKAQKHSGFRRVFNETQGYLRDVSSFALAAADRATGLLPKLGRAQDVLPKWMGGLGAASKEDVAAVSKATFAATLGDLRPSEQELAAGFTAEVKYGTTIAPITVPPLTSEQIKLFKQARAALDLSIDQMAVSQMVQIAKKHDTLALALKAAKDDPLRGGDIILAALRQRLADVGSAHRDTLKLTQDIAAVEKLAADAQQLQDQGYAPLQRFGQYTLKVQETLSGEAAPVMHYFGLFDSKSELYAMERDMREQYPDAEVTTGTLDRSAFTLFQGLSLPAVELFAKATGLERDEAYQDFYRHAVASRSALKQLLHRKGIAGYNEDLPRVLASFITSSARLTSRNYHYAQMNKLVTAIPQEEGDVRTEAAQLVKYVQSPVEEAPKLRALLFVNFIGGSIASALTNLTQTSLMTMPWLSQYSNPVQASARVLSAMKGGEPTDPALRAALKRAQLEGITDPQEIHQLYAESIRGFGSSLWARKGLRVWGAMFSLAESFNRRVTFTAAYQIAQERGMTAINAQQQARGLPTFTDPATFAFDFAEHAVEATQGIYNRGNRPNYARGPIGASIFTFRQFTIAYLEFLARLPAREQAVAAALLFMAVGAQGMPGADDLADLIDTLGQLMGWNTNFKKSVREHAVELLGETFGGLATHGISTVLPFDVQGRLGFANLIPGTALFKQSDTTRRAEEITEVVGPLGGLYKQGIAGFEALAAGQYGGALAAGAPLAVQNVLKGLDMAQSGAYRDVRGSKVIATDNTDAMLKSIGLQPEKVAHRQLVESDVQQSIALVKHTEAQIADRWARGILDKDSDEIAKAVKQLHQWNIDNPQWPIQITPYQIRQRVQTKMQERGARIAKAAPRDVRGEVRRELQ